MTWTNERLETGPYRHTPDDWQGVFIRGDQAIYFAMQLRSLLNGGVDDVIRDVVLAGLADILESCRE